MNYLKITIIIIIFFILFSLFYRTIKNKTINNAYEKNLNSDGFILFNNVFNNNELDYLRNNVNNDQLNNLKTMIINNKNLKNIIVKNIGNDYVFQDYIFVLKKSSLHTCHRDNNSKLLNKNQKYDSYTMIIFLYPMNECLDVIPKSHKNIKKNSFNFTDPTKSVKCSVGDVLVFNSSLIHCGSINNKFKNNPRIQLKISHNSDLKNIDFYQNYNKILDNESNISNLNQKTVKHLTCQFPILSNVTYGLNKKSFDKKKNSNLSQLSKIFNNLIYGKSDFLDKLSN